MHYVTAGLTTTPDSRAGRASGLAMPTTAFDWVDWLAAQSSGITLP